MDELLKCLRCGKEMNFIARDYIQLGKIGVILGQVSNYLSGGLEVEIYQCSACNKLEFFSHNTLEEDHIDQIKCPNCGRKHDMDYPKCPFCKYDYLVSNS